MVAKRKKKSKLPTLSFLQEQTNQRGIAIVFEVQAALLSDGSDLHFWQNEMPSGMRGNEAQIHTTFRNVDRFP